MKELHIITKEDELAEKFSRDRKKEVHSVDLRKGKVNYHELLDLIFESEHVYVW